MSENPSGIQPVEFKVLVEPKEIEETTASGIVLPPKTTEIEKQRQVDGKLVAVGGSAFMDWLPPIPEVGDTIRFAKYSGIVMQGVDGKEYRLIFDKDITAIIE